MSDLLLIDDPGQLVMQVRQAFPAPGHRIAVARTGAEGVARVRGAPPDVVLLNLGLPDQGGLAVYRQLRGLDGQVPVICVSGCTETRAAIEAIKQGAYDCLFEPPDPSHLAQVVQEALEIGRRLHEPSLTAEPAAAPETGGQLVGTCPAMRQVYKEIGLVTAQDCPVIITGESGTGKELVARAIHEHSDRAGRPFLALDAAAIPEALLESELFGHEKGAFTGAHGKRLGKFEQCQGGTLFLDEIGDMPPGSQAKVLRVMEEQAFERVGGNETIQTDLRLLAATHRDLAAWSAEGKFRPDLYYRLSVFTICLPPLRERGEDLPLLMRHYLRRLSRELGRAVHEIAPEALERLRRYSWPGNIRELQSVLKQALLRANGTVLLPAFLPDPLGGSGKPDPAITRREAPCLESFICGRLRPDACDLYAEAHRQVDSLLLPRVLAYTRGGYLKAAGLLGIARATLRLKLRQQGLLSSHPRWNREEEHLNPRQRPWHRSSNGAGSRGCKDLAGRD
jgi:two-component system nitrogen regulation response regulator GlnG